MTLHSHLFCGRGRQPRERGRERRGPPSCVWKRGRRARHMGQYATRVARLLVWCVLAALTCGASAACSGGGLLRLRGGGAVELTEIKDFLQITRRADARLVVIKKPKKSHPGPLKFKVRCSRYRYTYVVHDRAKAEKLRLSLPPGLKVQEIVGGRNRPNTNSI